MEVCSQPMEIYRKQEVVFYEAGVLTIYPNMELKFFTLFTSET